MLVTSHTHLHLKWTLISKFYSILSLFLLIIALISSIFQPHLNGDVIHIHNKKISREWIKNNYQVDPHGSRFFVFTDEKNNKTENLLLTSWFDNIIEGKISYTFGKNEKNFCFERSKIPEEEGFPTLFTASQLKASVQLPLRIIVLLGVCVRVSQTFFIFYLNIYPNPKNVEYEISCIFILLAVSTEIIHNISLFLLSSLLFTPDKEYLYVIPSVISLYHITFFIKMMISSINDGINRTSLIRILLAITSISCWQPVSQSIERYLQSQYCDSYDVFSSFISQIVMIFSTCGAFILDGRDSSRIVIQIDAAGSENESQL